MNRRARNFLAGAFFGAFALVFSPGPVALAGQSPGTDPNIFIQLAKKAVPSVVNISTLTTVKQQYGAGMSEEDLFRHFFKDFFHNQGRMSPPGGDDGDDDDGGGGDLPPPGSDKGAPKAMSLGTGFIIDSDGLILTNNHVVAGADEIKITFTEEADEQPTDGVVVGRDTDLDVALIKVKSKRTMVALPLGDSDALQVGQYVMAVGNPFGQGHSVTHGIISAKGRRAPDFVLASYLQTDAPINPGNSGGPLLNLRGEVIGINNAIDARAQGIGFAIPINLVKQILPQLRTKGTVTRGYIGVEVGDLVPEIASKIGAPKDLHAPFATNVLPGEPADKAGMKPYDVITEVDGKKIHDSTDLVRAVTSLNVGDKASIKVLRNGEEKSLTVNVSKRPGSQQTEKPEESRKKGKKTPSRINVGMELEDVTPDVARDLGLPAKAKGAAVSDIDYGGPADKAGLLRGDLIVEVDRKPVKSVDQFFDRVREKKGYLLRVRRLNPQGGETYTVVVLDLKS